MKIKASTEEKLERNLGYPLNNFRYAGGRQGRHKSYFNILSEVKLPNKEIPEAEDSCKCGHRIQENCFILHDSLKTLHVVGNCCVRFFEKSYRTCEICDERHKNTKIDRCQSCIGMWGKRGRGRKITAYFKARNVGGSTACLGAITDTS